MSLAGKSSEILINIFPLASKYYHYYFLWATWKNSKQYKHEMYIVPSVNMTWEFILMHSTYSTIFYIPPAVVHHDIKAGIKMSVLFSCYSIHESASTKDS